MVGPDPGLPTEVGVVLNRKCSAHMHVHACVHMHRHAPGPTVRQQTAVSETAPERTGDALVRLRRRTAIRPVTAP